VGFVRHLPHQLVDAFRSTLEEVAEADLILHVVDGSDADPRAQISAVREVLGEIGAGDVPELVVINKADAAEPIELDGLRRAERGSVVVSARTGAGIDELLAGIERLLPRHDRQVSVTVPYDRGDLVSRAHQEGEVLTVRHGQEGTELTARVPPGLAAELDRFRAPAIARLSYLRVANAGVAVQSVARLHISISAQLRYGSPISSEGNSRRRLPAWRAGPRPGQVASGRARVLSEASKRAVFRPGRHGPGGPQATASTADSVS
jgi:hypothetical protein